MKKKPNILFILSDQHSPHVIGCENNNIINTPNLDKLAKEGAYFTNTYCQNPLCVPSRASLLTGKYSKSIGIYDNMHIMQSNSQTLPSVFGEQGYKTCLIGKAHFNGEQFHGYQQRPYGDLYGQGHQPDPKREECFGINGLGDVLGNAGPSEMPIELTQTEICVKEVCKWLQIHQETSTQPFLLSIHFDKPHFPIKPPKKYFDNYHDKVEIKELPKDFDENFTLFTKEAIANNETGHHFKKDKEIQKRALQAYYGCVEWIDDGIGRIVKVLDYLGLAEDTIVIYSSDHGEMGSEHGTWQKTLFYEASVRVPLIIRWPNQIKASSSYNDIVGLIDLFPTLCDLCDIKIPETIEGESLKPILNNNDKLLREGIFSESAVLRKTEIAGCMYRTNRYKYCYYINEEQELFDLINDPEEYNNLYEDMKNTQLVKDFRNKVIQFFQPNNYHKRLGDTPIMHKEKHFYPYSNQFMIGDGIVVDGKP